MKVKTVVDFIDKEAKVNRAVGEVFECSKERFAAINGTQYGVLIEQVQEEKPAAKKLTTRSKAKKAE